MGIAMSLASSDSSQLSYRAADRHEPVLDLSLGDALRSAVAAWPHRLALVGGVLGNSARCWTFQQWLDDAAAVAAALLSRVQPGEHVAIWASNVPEWVLMEFGAALAGLTLVTVNPAYLGAELAFVLKQSQACGIIVQDSSRNRDLVGAVKDVRDTLPAIREIIPLSSWTEFVSSARAGDPLPSVRPDDVAQIQYTSGT